MATRADGHSNIINVRPRNKSVAPAETRPERDKQTTEYWYPVLFQVVLNVCYVLCIVPFRFKAIGSSAFAVHTNCIQRILCGILHVTVIVISVLGIKLKSSYDVATNPKEFYDLIYSIFTVLECLAFLKLCYSGKESLLKALNDSQQSTSMMTKVFAAGLCGYALVTACLLHYSYWDDGITDDGNRYYVQSLTFQELDFTGNVTVSQYIQGVTVCTMEFAKQLVTSFSQLYPMLACCAVLEMWVAQEKIIFDTELILMKIMEMFKACVNRNILMNAAVGNLVFWTFASFFILVPVRCPLIFNVNVKNSFKIAITIPCVVIVVVLIIAAKATEQANKCRRYVQNLLSEKTPDSETGTCCLTRQILWTADTVNDIGVHGGKFFVISFSFFAAVSSGVFGYILMIMDTNKPTN